MATLVEIETDSGPVLFQVPSPAGDVAPVGRGRDVIEQIGEEMGSVLGLVGGVARGFEAAIRDSPVESGELEFNLQFSAKGTIYVVETQGQGSIKVKLTVKPDRGSLTRA